MHTDLWSIPDASESAEDERQQRNLAVLPAVFGFTRSSEVHSNQHRGELEL